MALTSSPEALAVQELERVRWLHLYTDRVLIGKSAYVAAARQLEKRAIRSRLWTLGLTALFVVSAAGEFVEFGRTSRVSSMVAGYCQVVLGLVFAVQSFQVVVQVRELRRNLEALFPAQAVEDNDPVAA